MRRDLIAAERATLIGLRNEGRIRNELVRKIERDLDLDEARIRPQ
jgi:CPA1 family monovalent cation:H+ antiporter